MRAALKRRRYALAVALLASELLAAPPSEPDPNELYGRAVAQIQDGELEAAQSTTDDLRKLISENSRWDPDSAFSVEILPSLADKLARLRSAERSLDALRERYSASAHPPKLEPEQMTVRAYADWALGTIDRMRVEVETVISAELASADERGALARTAGYARMQRFLEAGILERVAAVMEKASGGPLTGDETARALRARLDGLKRNTMEMVEEEKRLRIRLQATQERLASYRGALAALIAEDTASSPRPLESGNLDEVLGDVVERHRAALASRQSLGTGERRQWEAAIERCRRYNAILVQAGLGADRSDRIEALAEQVRGIPLEGPALPAGSGPDR